MKICRRRLSTTSSLRHHGQDARLLRLAALGAVIGAASTGAAFLLLALIRLFTNLFFFQALSAADRSPATHALGAGVILLPAVGGLVVGLMARFGSDRIRGHGIPEAIEAILFGRSSMSPRVAVLKPLASGIAIGSGGPFGAEGPIIMTGGAIGSLLAQHVHLSAAERKTLMWVVALGSGTSEGVLAPLLMLRAGVGVAMGHALPCGDPLLWPLACMAATLGATFQAPLTAIVFAIGATDALARYFGPGQVHRAYPVASSGRLIGLVDRETLAALRTESADAALVELLAGKTPAFALAAQSCRAVATRLAREGRERLPVVADAQSLRIVGIVSRNDMVKPSLAHFHEEDQRQRPRSLQRRQRRA